MSVDALERVIADACLDRQAEDAIAGDLRAFLEARGVAPEDVEAIVSAPPRLAIYRSLVRNGLARTVVRMMPRTRARMNAACGGRFDADLARFLEQAAPRTHYLRDVPQELFAWAAPEWRADPGIPPYLPELADHELTAFAVAAAEADSATAFVEVELHLPLVLTGSARLRRYAWAVHELGTDEHATNQPQRRDVRLLAYRDGADAVRWLELTPLAATLVERLAAREPLGAAIADACAAHGTTATVVGAEVARLLADLGDRGVVLGGSATGRG